MKRMNRRWANIPAEQINKLAEGITPGAYSKDWMSANEENDAAETVPGNFLHISFSDGTFIKCVFSAKNKLQYSENGSAYIDCYYRAVAVPGHPDLVFIKFYLDGQLPPQSIDIVLDYKNGYAVMVHAYIGVPEYPREARHKILIGEIEGYAHPDGSCAPSFTTDLVGKAVLWHMPAYTGKPPIKHIYLSPEYYAIHMTRPDGSCFMSADPADYVKIRDGIYLISVIEERRSGIQLTFVINTDLLEDVVGHFGISAGNEGPEELPRIVCTVMTGRKGQWVPMETIH